MSQNRVELASSSVPEPEAQEHVIRLKPATHRRLVHTPGFFKKTVLRQYAKPTSFIFQDGQKNNYRKEETQLRKSTDFSHFFPALRFHMDK